MYEDLTPDDIREEILTKIPNLDTREGSFVSDLTAPVSNAIYNLYMAMNALIPIAFVDETSGEFIDKRAREYGVIRKEGVKARVSYNSPERMAQLCLLAVFSQQKLDLNL